jgi:hypothetical protein
MTDIPLRRPNCSGKVQIDLASFVAASADVIAPVLTKKTQTKQMADKMRKFRRYFLATLTSTDY